MRPLKSCVSLWQRLQRLCEAFFQARRLTQTFLQQPVAIVPPGPSPRIVRSSRYEFSPNTLRRIPSKYKSRQFVIRLCLGPVAGAQLKQDRESIMKKSLITMACALVAPVAFAQTSTTVTEQTTSAPVTTTTSTTYETGTVTTYTPGKTIVVNRERTGPVSFALGTASRVVDATGKIITAPLRAGQKVRVYYTGTGDTRVVERVQVED